MTQPESGLSLLVPQAFERAITRKVERLAQKCGVPIARIEGETYLAARNPEHDPADDRSPETIPIACQRLTLGTLPRFQGWTLVARLEHTEGGIILHNAPGQECPSHYREGTNACEHCGHKRRRKETLIIRSPEGSLRQVGRNCLADYLTQDPTRWIHSAELLALVGRITDEEGWPEEPEKRLGQAAPWTDRYLAFCVASCRVHGFRPTKLEGSTKDAVLWAMRKPPNSPQAYKDWLEVQPTKADREKARKIIERFRAQPDSNDYQQNLKVALSCAAVPFKRMGLVASAPSAYDRALNIEREKAAASETKANAASGRVEFEGEVLALKWQDSDYGGCLKVLLKVTNPDGSTWRCWGTVPRAYADQNRHKGKNEPERGERLKLRARLTPKTEDPTFAFFSRPTLLSHSD